VLFKVPVAIVICLRHPKYHRLRGRATSEYGFALVYQPLGFGHGSLQTLGRGFQPGEGGLDAADVTARLCDGYRGLADQIDDPIRFRQIGKFILFEFGGVVGVAA
jgi:hypothetical protein